MAGQPRYVDMSTIRQALQVSKAFKESDSGPDSDSTYTADAVPVALERGMAT